MSCKRRIEYFSLLTLEVWKYGNVSPLSLSINSGSVEIWKCGNVSWSCCLYLVTLRNSGSVEVWKCGSVEMWKCGNVEICLRCLYLITGDGHPGHIS